MPKRQYAPLLGRTMREHFCGQPSFYHAMDALNGMSLAGRPFTVNEARPREPRREPRQPRW
jgi:hypothetical protein